MFSCGFSFMLGLLTWNLEFTLPLQEVGVGNDELLSLRTIPCQPAILPAVYLTSIFLKGIVRSLSVYLARLACARGGDHGGWALTSTSRTVTPPMVAVVDSVRF